jgi:DNA-directed RNA polymerase subunit RPC12/RpoP
MRVRINASVDVSKWTQMLSPQVYNRLWHKAVALATPKNRDRCPKCGSRDFLRSHRKNILEFAASSFVLPYRCSHCYFRFFRANEAAADPKRYRTHYPSLQHARRT